MGVHHALKIVTLILTFGRKSVTGKSVVENHQSDDNIFNRNYLAVIFDERVSYTDLWVNHPYNETGLLVLINKIHTKFDKIVVPVTFDNYGTDFEGVILAAAKYNMELNKDLKYMQVFVQITPSIKLDMISKLKALNDTVITANQNFPGTVTHILLHYDRETAVQSESLLKLFHSDSANYFLLNVGIALDTNFVDGFIEATKNPTFPKLDSIFLESKPTKEEIDDADNNYVSIITNIFDAAKNKILQNIEWAETTKIGLSSGWPDTSESGSKSYHKLVQFWKAMSNWAALTSATVILDRAFDSPYYYWDLNRLTSGWWRLVENSSYEYTSDYIFEEKTSLISEDKNYWTIDPEKHATFLNPGRNCLFSANHSVVWMTPFVSDNHKIQYDNASQLVPQVSLVSKKFRRIMVDLGEVKNCSLLSPLPESIALYNKNSESEEHEAPIEVFLKFRPSFDLSIARQQMECIMKSANAANFKYPDTVKTILIQAPQNFHLSNYSDILGRFKEINYGVVLPLDNCNGPVNGTRFLKYLNEYLSTKLRMSYIFLLDYPFHSTTSVDKIFSQFTNAVESCRRKIEMITSRDKLTPHVGFITGWPAEVDKSKIVPMVNYWEMVNRWSKKTNTTVIYKDAFDKLPRDEKDYYGWWMFDNFKSYWKVEDYKFFEKKKFIMEQDGEDIPDYQDSCEDLPSVTITTEVASWTDVEEFTVSTPPDKNSDLVVPASPTFTALHIIGIMGAVIVALIIIAVGIFCLLNRKITVLSKKYLLQELNRQEENGDNPHIKAYDEHRWEIEKEYFEIDATRKLGSGQYGKVCFAKVKQRRSSVYVNVKGCNWINVAVKMSKVSTKEALMGLLEEVKLMAYLGAHNNIVSLIGAHTADLSEGKLYMFLELCEMGSLLNHLRKINPAKKNNNDEEEGYCNSGLTLVSDLHKWAWGILNGMEYLAKMKIVHMDLAARNVLLTSEKEAKISDFGLSRRMQNYTYTKTKNDRLPWKWMAPESLHELVFTEKSDVWSFGITLWEIYTFGKDPYPGASCNERFISDLEQGRILSEPNYCQASIYPIMRKCWTLNPDERPTFADLQHNFLN